jgi:hypothetical protein
VLQIYLEPLDGKSASHMPMHCRDAVPSKRAPIKRFEGEPASHLGVTLLPRGRQDYAITDDHVLKGRRCAWLEGVRKSVLHVVTLLTCICPYFVHPLRACNGERSSYPLPLVSPRLPSYNIRSYADLPSYGAARLAMQHASKIGNLATQESHLQSLRLQLGCAERLGMHSIVRLEFLT